MCKENLVCCSCCSCCSLCTFVCITLCLYSRTSNKGPSEKGTTSPISIRVTSNVSIRVTSNVSIRVTSNVTIRVTSNIPKVYMQYISTSEKRTTSLQETKWLVPKCPLLEGSTVQWELHVDCPTFILFCCYLQGHVSMMNGACWHPRIKENFITCSNDW